jgi:hypothetical protein
MEFSTDSPTLGKAAMNIRHLTAMLLSLAFIVPSHASEAGAGGTASMGDKRGKKIAPAPTSGDLHAAAMIGAAP